MKTFIGKFNLKQYRDGKLIADVNTENSTTMQGMKRILDVIFNNISPGAINVGLIAGPSLPTLSINDTATSHAGWTELVAGTRPQLTQVSATSRTSYTDTYTSPNVGALYSVTSGGNARGIFVITADNNYLWATAAGVNVVLNVGDKVFITYAVQLSVGT